ncbi:MAG TPA: phosphoribosyltransferase family protein [Chloroflexia bacterium]|nr:phosphoribosyltransferase family protein [Chloroflexia bacterium]
MAEGGAEPPASEALRFRVFDDRRDAGRRLAARLGDYRGQDVLVLALPRGGVPVGYEVARHLNAPLDVFIARKLGAPNQPELGIGAVAPGGVLVLDMETIQHLGRPDDVIARVATRELDEMERRLRRFRGEREMPAVEGRTVILVDDGLATGVTASAAIRSLRQMSPARLVLAVPVCAPQTAQALRTQVDDLVYVEMPHNFGAVGLWYRNFDQTTDEEVVDLLSRARQALDAPAQENEASSKKQQKPQETTPVPVQVPAGKAKLDGDLVLPADPQGVVLFAHGSGSSRHSPRNRYVASVLNAAGFATLLIDLLTPQEEAEDISTRHLRFDIAMLAGRLAAVTDWLAMHPDLGRLPVGLFGASTGGGAALVAASERPEAIYAVVSRGGRPDLAGDALPDVHAPTLLIVGGDDRQVIALNKSAMARMHCVTHLEIVPGAGHLFEERGALEQVAKLAAEWFKQHLSL